MITIYENSPKGTRKEVLKVFIQRRNNTKLSSGFRTESVGDRIRLWFKSQLVAEEVL